MEMKTIARVGGPTREQMRSRQKRSQPLTYISVDGVNYAMQWTTLRNLAIDNFDEIEEMSAKYGQDDVGMMGRTCHMCNFNAESIPNVMLGTVASPNFGSDACTYESKGVVVASEFVEKKTRKRFYALENACSVDEAMVRVLHEKGLLAGYEVTSEFNYKPISDFENKSVSPDDFVSGGASLVDKVLDLLKI